ncbi:MAG: hypothetical protein OSJ59_11005 [Lachnospiraceae bacterium]|nr:hypothetical protein [Lachnospiraceae bacterium]
MNNLEEWGKARETVKRALKHWKPHFEILNSENGEKLRAFFLLDDTSVEWKLYDGVPEESKKDFADYMQDAKEELLEKVGFEFETQEEEPTDAGTRKANEKLSKCMKEYERKTGLGLPGLVFNMLFYSEWLALPEDILEKRYEEEMNRAIQ